MTLQTGTHTFTGQIVGVGFAEGTRVVVGRWTDSPFGAFTDVMVERADGTRILLAPTEEIASTVDDLYTFDEVTVVPVDVRTEGRTLDVQAGPLALTVEAGDRTPLGHVLSAVPSALGRSSWWSRVTDPVAKAVMQGVSTRGTTANGLTATYGASDLRSVTSAHASWEGQDLGELRPVTPPVRFGFGSTPSDPSVTTLTTTIEVPAPDPLTGVIDCWGMGALRDKQAREAAAAPTRGGSEAHLVAGVAGSDDDGTAEREHILEAETHETDVEDHRASTSAEARIAEAIGADSGAIPTPLNDERRDDDEHPDDLLDH